jgi:hypothetical protein
VVDSRPATGEAVLDALGRQADRFDELDRAAAAVAKGGIVNELGRLTARDDGSSGTLSTRKNGPAPSWSTSRFTAASMSSTR